MRKRTAIVVVLYHARLSERLIGLSREDSSLLIVIDNTPDRDLGIGDERLVYIPLKVNKGIAFAQNRGIEEAFRYRCGYVVFFDQDSEIPAGYVSGMVEEYERVKSIYSHLAILGPIIVNVDKGVPYKSASVQSVCDCKCVDRLISSGTIIETRTILQVGMMDESLFIDSVDFEWCWRAKNKGYVSVMTERVSLYHKVGQHDRSFLGYPVIVSSPSRYYYQYRNYLWLYRRNYVPISYKLKIGIRKIIEFLYIPLIAKNGMDIVKNMLLGIKDGIRKI